MVSTHVLASHDPDGSLTNAQWLAGGRASALFAVLAGVSLALMTGRRTPVHGRERGRRSLALATRAVLVATIGLALGGLETGIAVILTYYGVLFLMALPFLGLTTKPLLALAAAWVVVGPVVSQVVRPHLPERRYDSPHFAQLADPGPLLSELLFTGYYPCVPWLAYVLLGHGAGPRGPGQPQAPGLARRCRAGDRRPRDRRLPLADQPGRGRHAAARGLAAGDDHRPAARRHRRRHVRADPRRRLVGVAAGGGAAQQHAVRPGAHDGLGGLRPRRLPRRGGPGRRPWAAARWPCSSVPGR